MAKISATLKDLKDAKRMVPIMSSFNLPDSCKKKIRRILEDESKLLQTQPSIIPNCSCCAKRWPQACGIIWKLHSFLSL